jgi:predicted RNA binding protein YcfA (HicA-like mRNA interferase family)
VVAPQIWHQLKNLTADDLIAALLHDGWTQDTNRGAVRVYLKAGNPKRRVTIHYHPKSGYQPSLLKHLIADIGWTEDDLRRLRLVK